jgi:hypothetical protein
MKPDDTTNTESTNTAKVTQIELATDREIFDELHNRYPHMVFVGVPLNNTSSWNTFMGGSVLVRLGLADSLKRKMSQRAKALENESGL